MFPSPYRVVWYRYRYGKETRVELRGPNDELLREFKESKVLDIAIEALDSNFSVVRSFNVDGANARENSWSGSAASWRCFVNGREISIEGAQAPLPGPELLSSSGVGETTWERIESYPTRAVQLVGDGRREALFYPSGTIRSIDELDANGILHGTSTQWDPSGEIIAQNDYVVGVLKESSDAPPWSATIDIPYDHSGSPP